MSEVRELELTRVFAAPRELVFDCLTDPQHLSQFWGPAGMHAPVERITVDLRPGGRFETVMVGDRDGREVPTRATYVEVRRPELLVWHEAHSGMTVTLTFADLGDGRTEVRLRQADVPPAALTPQARAGFATSLDRFARYLDQLERESRC